MSPILKNQNLHLKLNQKNLTKVIPNLKVAIKVTQKVIQNQKLQKVMKTIQNQIRIQIQIKMKKV